MTQESDQDPWWRKVLNTVRSAIWIIAAGAVGLWIFKVAEVDLKTVWGGIVIIAIGALYAFERQQRKLARIDQRLQSIEYSLRRREAGELQKSSVNAVEDALRPNASLDELTVSAVEEVLGLTKPRPQP